MKLLKNNIVSLIIMAVIIGILGFISINSIADDEISQISNDNNMVTNYYKSDVVVNNDNTYSINEKIDVSFLSPKHGIYRYIPYLGQISRADSEGYFEKIPYYADVDVINSSEEIHSIDNTNGNKCITIGDEDVTLTGDKEYSLKYKITPKAQGGYTTIYYNIFPTYWQNLIPAGSEFSIQFPKEIPHNIVNLYYGKYGQNYNASNIVELYWEDNKVTGKLKENLPLGSGLTLYAPVGNDYFENVNVVNSELYLYIGGAILICVLVMFLYFKFGRDDKIIPTIQFNPPKELDSAAAGFIIDGYADDKDIISLFLYLADKGYIQFNKVSKKELQIIKLKNLDKNIAPYIRTVFEGIFSKDAKIGKAVELSSLKYIFEPSLSSAKQSLKDAFEENIYTKSSKVSRVICCALCIVPISIFILINNVMTYTTIGSAFIYGALDLIYAFGIVLLCSVADSWYSMKRRSRTAVCISGLILSTVSLFSIGYYYFIRTIDTIAFRWYYSLSVMLISTVIMSICTVFMKKRTSICIKFMNYLAGFKDFIEKAELDRIRSLAEENPNWFYDVLPYAYVFGLSDIWIKKFEEISIKKPEWYSGYGYDYNYLIFNRMLMSDLNRVESICRTVQPSSNSSSDGSSWGGGGSSGGGFSGGGFGGGGGGSW
ncbi:MAG: DUF2207 domain-containing protein, partial [Clostridium sp.]|nr:DUF2207 domain-containing protein [Clostridium sp.]